MTSAPQRRLANVSDGASSGATGRFRSPLYHQIYLILRQRIADGDFGAAGVLPSEQELAADHGVSRITTKRALDELANDGLVVRERGRGTRVVANAAAGYATEATSLFESLAEMGGATDVSVIEFEYVAADHDLASALEIEGGEPVQRAVRVRSTEGAAFSHLTTFIPATIGEKWDAEALATTPLLTLLEQAGATAATAEQSVSATLADTRVARDLGVDVGAPLLRVRRTVRDATGRVVERLVALYRSDHYRMTMTLNRTPGAWETRSLSKSWSVGEDDDEIRSFAVERDP